MTEADLKISVDEESWWRENSCERLKLKRHNLHLLKPNEPIDICGHEFLPIPVDHDAQEPVNFTIDDELLFVTDAGTVPNVSGNFRKKRHASGEEFIREAARTFLEVSK